MPWTAADAPNHIKGLTKKQRKKWSAIANGVFDSCKGDKDCEAKAIKIANSKFQSVIPFNPTVPAEMEEKLKKMSVLEPVSQNVDIPEMEIFRTGTHNGEPFDNKDLEQIAENFDILKGEVRPKLKITHEKNQTTLAGKASYGDVVSVTFRKMADGSGKLFAALANVPKQVADWIKERRFPERSIELYGKLKLGTKTDDKIYRNVLKAIALLGSEMPAVSGMAPIQMKEILEIQETICFGEMCFPCAEEAKIYQQTLVSASIMADMLAAKLN